MFSIVGNSGCQVELVESNDQAFVRKSTTNQSYFSRLKKQAQKQSAFIENNNRKDIYVPRIIHEDFQDRQRQFFDMEFCRSIDCLSYLQTSSIKEIEEFFKIVISVIDRNISHSEMKDFNREAFLEKYSDVKSNIKKQNIDLDFSRINTIFNTVKVQKIPVGKCHGDLTLSNILVQSSEKRICLIDFLDSFIETPLQDIVKLRQDTKYFWTLNLHQGANLDLTKIKMILKYLDKKVESHYARHNFYKKYYQSFQIMNLLRVLQYCKDKNLQNFVVRHIKVLEKEV